MAVISRKQSEVKWTEGSIIAAIGRQFFRSSYAIIVPTCNFTGHECDVLAVSKCRRIVDVEIKVSRADFKADAKKRKWWHGGLSTYCSETRRMMRAPAVRRDWPPGVWKHYFVMPASVWSDDLVDALPSPNCGVITIDTDPRLGTPVARCVRRCKPNRNAKRITDTDAINLARLASLRMLDAFRMLEARK